MHLNYWWKLFKIMKLESKQFRGKKKMLPVTWAQSRLRLLHHAPFPEYAYSYGQKEAVMTFPKPASEPVSSHSICVCGAMPVSKCGLVTEEENSARLSFLKESILLYCFFGYF